MTTEVNNMQEEFRPWIVPPWVWVKDNPYKYEQVELMREEWEKPFKTSPVKLPPELNVSDLWWRPC